MISRRILFGILIIEPFPHRVLFFRAEGGVRLAQDLRRPGATGDLEREAVKIAGLRRHSIAADPVSIWYNHPTRTTSLAWMSSDASPDAVNAVWPVYPGNLFRFHGKGG